MKILEETKIEEEEKTKKREEILKKYSLENVIKDGSKKGTLCRQRRRDRTDYRVSFRDLPGLNTMLREAAMVMGSRVRGLMP